MIGIALLLLGALIGFFGIVIRIAPGLDRPKRRWLYSRLFTRGLYRLRANTEKGNTPDNVDDKWVVRAVLDVIETEFPHDLPDRKVVAVTPFGADIKLHFADGDERDYPTGKLSHQIFESVVSDAMASKYRWYGLLIAGLGVLMSGVGVMLTQLL